jgi:hypothetical protein
MAGAAVVATLLTACDDFEALACRRLGCDAGVEPSDAGTGDAGTCDGCRAAPEATCVALADTTSIACGLGGAACQPCGSNEWCWEGQCIPDAGPVRRIGDECAVDADCNGVITTAAKKWCKKTMSVSGQPYPSGYCTKRCGISVGCGLGAVLCSNGFGVPGEGDSICLAACGSSTCRAGYVCADVAIGATPQQLACIPAGPDGGVPVFDAGSATTIPAGSACASASECGPSPWFSCLSELAADGGPSGYAGGYCTGDCSQVETLSRAISWCGPSSACLWVGLGSDARGDLLSWRCFGQCDPANDGGCRPGYSCQEPNSGAGFVCLPDCRLTPGLCGTKFCDPASGRCR